MTGRFFCTGWVVSPNSSRKPVGIAIPAGPPFAFPEKCEAPTLHGAPPQVKSSQVMPSQVGPQGGRRWLVFGLTNVSEAVRARRLECVEATAVVVAVVVLAAAAVAAAERKSAKRQTRRYRKLCANSNLWCSGVKIIM